jgi:tRNA(fMet)-specific endonuclease VapC
MAYVDIMILCDTNILIDFYKNQPDVTAILRRVGVDEIAISVVTQAELYVGALKKQELEAIRRHLSLISRLPISEAVSVRFIVLMERYSLSHNLSIPDALIAATALEFSIPLYTKNLEDFRFIPELALFET